jgi:hypothetical protein
MQQAEEHETFDERERERERRERERVGVGVRWEQVELARCIGLPACGVDAVQPGRRRHTAGRQNQLA